jgi:hypothetical protein
LLAVPLASPFLSFTKKNELPVSNEHPMLLNKSNLSTSTSRLLQLFTNGGTCTSFLWCWWIHCAGTNSWYKFKASKEAS